MAKVIYLRKVRGSTLIEVLIAVIIISVVFTIALSIFSNIQRSSSLHKKLRYKFAMNECYQETTLKRLYADREVQHSNFLVVQTVHADQRATSLWAIHIEVFDEDGKLLAAQKHLVYDN